MATILVTAATSQLGQAAVEHLLTLVDPSSIAVTVRDKSKVPSSWDRIDLRVADYSDDIAKWSETLRGIERVLLISSTALGEERVKQHSTVVEAARNAGVKLLAYTSILYGDKSPLPLAADHIRTESVIKSSGVPYVFLRNGWYTENYLRAKPGWEHAGKQNSAAGDARFSAAARRDYAHAAAVVLAPDYKGTNEALELAGDESFNYTELTDFVSDKLGRKVTVEELSPEAYEQVLVGIGIPQGFAHVLALVDVESKKGALENNSKTLSKVIGRPTTAWRETIGAAL